MKEEVLEVPGLPGILYDLFRIKPKTEKLLNIILTI